MIFDVIKEIDVDFAVHNCSTAYHTVNKLYRSTIVACLFCLLAIVKFVIFVIPRNLMLPWHFQLVWMHTYYIAYGIGSYWIQCYDGSTNKIYNESMEHMLKCLGLIDNMIFSIHKIRYRMNFKCSQTHMHNIQEISEWCKDQWKTIYEANDIGQFSMCLAQL